MAEFYSNHYQPLALLPITGVGYDARATGVFYAPTGFGEMTLKVKRARFAIPSGVATWGAVGDTISFMDFMSGDRPVYVWVTLDTNQGASTSDWDIGLYESSVTGIGGLITADTNDMFGGAEDFAANIDRVDYFKLGATTFTDLERGSTFWELVNSVTASTYTEDPHKTWTLAATSTDAVATTGAIHVWDIEVHYFASGD